jgi:prolyl 4-hydroxylase
MPTPPPVTLADAIALVAEGRIAEGIPIVQQMAGRGDPEALFALGDIFWRGVGVVQDFPRGRALFRMASEAGHPIAVRAYTNLLASGIAGERNWPEALRRLEAEARVDALRARMLAVVRQMALTPEGDPVRLPEGERLADRPDARLYKGAFTAAECDFLILLAEPTYEPSLILDDDREVRDRIRTSDGSTLHWLIEDPATHAVNRRLAALTGTRVEQGEALQILRYRPGQEYRPHVDWLGEDNPRVLTALVYLNDDYAGGETAFVETGLKVRGRRGDVLVFRSEGPSGGLDPLSKHAGLPVTAGTKYLASRWIRAGRHSL